MVVNLHPYISGEMAGTNANAQGSAANFMCVRTPPSDEVGALPVCADNAFVIRSR